MTRPLRDVRSDGWDAPSGLVALLLHGYGADERDLVPLAGPLGLTVPWASLRAPIDLGAGAAWFVVSTPGAPDPSAVEAATADVWAWVDEHVPAEAGIVPIGFSQGGLMASQLLRTRPDRVVAPVVLGGFVLGAAQPGDAVLRERRPAVFWGRGAEDRVITADAVARTEAFLPEHADLTRRVYAGLGHGISAAEASDVRAFLAAATA